MSTSKPPDGDVRNHKFAIGMNTIRALPETRKAKQVVSPKELDCLIMILQEFLASAKRTTPPTKSVLRRAVLSLMQQGTVLSRQWDKTQLALVVLKWAVSSLRLRPLEDQTHLFVEVRVSSEDPKVIAHKCCLRDEISQEVLAFSIASPSPSKKRAPRNPEAGGLAEGAEPPSATSFDDSDEFDAEFLREIDELANHADLAAIPVNFYTPRVGNSVTKDSDASGCPPATYLIFGSID